MTFVMRDLAMNNHTKTIGGKGQWHRRDLAVFGTFIENLTKYRQGI